MGFIPRFLEIAQSALTNWAFFVGWMHQHSTLVSGLAVPAVVLINQALEYEKLRKTINKQLELAISQDEFEEKWRELGTK